MQNALLSGTVECLDGGVQLGFAGRRALFEQRVARLDHLGADSGFDGAIAHMFAFAGPDALARGSGVGHARSSTSLNLGLGRAARAAYQPGTHEVRSISASVSHLSSRVVPAYAKLNLSLSVVGRRADGYHDIDSILVPIDWHDLVGVGVTFATAGRVDLEVTGPAAAGVPLGDSNLTVRAARALEALAGRPLDVRLWLDKAVPHGAGLGGGSADAAAVLRAGVAGLATLGIAIDGELLATAALAIGSDVPALLDLAAHRVRGRGEWLAPVPAPAPHPGLRVAA